MYILKVKGKAKIPDYVQIRDDNFVLVAYFRADRPLKKHRKIRIGRKGSGTRDFDKGVALWKNPKIEL
jgi:hypothetical protein